MTKTKIKKYKNIVEEFLSGESGQRFFNFAYSIGAAIVIWGALFKILHLPGGNTLLSIGMGTEVLMFILTAFDRPNRDYHWEEVFPQLRNNGEKTEETPETEASKTEAHGGVVIIGGQPVAAGTPPVAPPKAEGAGVTIEGTTSDYIASMESIADQMRQLSETTAALNRVSQTLLDSYNAVSQNSDEINRDSAGYVEQMRTLNRNISGLNTIYEIHLRSISSQLDAIESVNRGIKDMRDMWEKSSERSARYCEETEKMAYYMQQINQVYDNMLRAMTLNATMMGHQPSTPVAPATTPAQPQPQNN
ncbi:MAG: gliding motility protein GldL [Bacteroidales bacterium]|nr:gliding motility protein GldL [Bacteroidales bacterium]